MKRANIIYGLADPRTGEVRYVGQSCQGLARPRAHTCPSVVRKEGGLHSTRWIAELQRVGLKPTIRVLEEFKHAEELDLAECFWIAQGRGLGWPLTNHADGGGGMRGFKMSAETRAKMSADRRGKTHPGHKHSAESRAKISAARLGKKSGPETRAKLSAALRGKKFTEEHRRRISESKKAYHARRAAEVLQPCGLVYWEKAR